MLDMKIQNYRHFVLLLLLLIPHHISTSSSSEFNLTSSPLECGFIFVTVSSLQSWLVRNPSEKDRIELNWDLSQCDGVPSSNIPNQISLYRSNPLESNDSVPVTSIFTKDHEAGYYITDIRLGKLEFPWGWHKKSSASRNYAFPPPGNYCLPFWIASFKDGKLLKINCLKIRPTWMYDTRESIRDLPFSRMLIPGTHNAGSYQFSPSFVKDLFERFTLCQDVDIWSQLVFGIRYFDFRVSYYSADKNKLWLNHGIVKVRPLLPLLYDIKMFLDATTHEIIILDIHQLPVGFYDANGMILSSHQLLLNVLQDIFRDHIVHYSNLMEGLHPDVGPTVTNITKSGRLIIGYPDNIIININKWLWPAVSHKWANTNDPQQLKNYLNRVMNVVYHPRQLWSAMAQMTPTPLDVLWSDKSLRKMANEINRNLTYWVQYEWAYKANIVASDFFMGNNVIDLAVHFSIIRALRRRMTLSQYVYH